ncbi:MAG: molybdopterin molybdotransferase [Granulosicoccus sp.]
MAALTPVDDVIETLLAQASIIGEFELVPLRLACGRVLANSVTSTVNVPPHDNSAMDGYVVDVNDPMIVVGGKYVVSDRIPAGYVGQALLPGTVARIFTGAPIPEGANTVVIQEDTVADGDSVEIIELPALGANVRPRGQDITLGAQLLCRGRILKAADLGLLASVGISEVRVYRKLKIAIMSTGDELIEPPNALAPGQIYNSNHYTLASMIEELGMEVVDLGLVADSLAATVEALSKGAETADCVISSGGVSVGEEDHVKAAVESLGALDLWKVAIKPGKPLAFGSVNGVPFFGLPGNPVSSFVTFTIIAKPYLLKYQGCDAWQAIKFSATSQFEYEAGNRREYVRVRVFFDTEGPSAELFDGQGSGVMSSVSWANALAEIEANTKVVSGDKVKIHPIS